MESGQANACPDNPVLDLVALEGEERCHYS